MNKLAELCDSNSSLKFLCMLSVWGKQYTEIFLEIALPAQLSSGNLPSLPTGSIFQIYTTTEDEQSIRQHSAFKRLLEVMPVEIYLIEDKLENRYLSMSNGHKRAIEQANTRGFALMFLTPDCIIANGSLKRAFELTKSGKKVISCVGLRLKQESVIPLIRTYFHPEDNSINIAAENLMSIALENLHSITTKHIWGGSTEMIPNNLFWEVPGEGLVGRCFHLHPLVVNPTNRDTHFLSTIDFDYPLSACPKLNDHYVVPDSDEICICELTTEKLEFHGVPNASMEELINFAEVQVNSNHLNNACTIIKLHSKIQNPEKWNQVIQTSEKILQQLIEALRTSSWTLLFQDPKRLIKRLIKQEQEAAISNNIKGVEKWQIILTGKISKFIFTIYSKYLYVLRPKFFLKEFKKLL